MLWSVIHDCTCTCIADHCLMWKCHPALIEQRLYWHPCRSLTSDIVLQPFVAASSSSSSVFFLFEAARCSRFSPSNVLLVCPMIVLYELDTRLSICHAHGFFPPGGHSRYCKQKPCSNFPKNKCRETRFILKLSIIYHGFLISQ